MVLSWQGNAFFELRINIDGKGDFLLGTLHLTPSSLVSRQPYGQGGYTFMSSMFSGDRTQVIGISGAHKK